MNATMEPKLHCGIFAYSLVSVSDVRVPYICINSKEKVIIFKPIFLGIVVKLLYRKHKDVLKKEIAMLDFLLQYVLHPMKVGAIAPSSKYLAKCMLEGVNFNRCNCIIEYGPGTGVFTKDIIKRKKKETLFLVIEDNREFCDKLISLYSGQPNVHIIHGQAENIENYLKQFKVNTVDYIISGLPFASLPKEISMQILERTQHIIHRNGKFITFQYSLLKRNLFQDRFNIIECKREYRNLPPAYILKMVKKEDVC